MTIQQLQDQITPILQKYDVIRASVFGSVARGEEKEGSDVDILVELSTNKKGLDFIGYFEDLRQDIQEKLHKKVDLVQYHLIKKNLRPYIEKDQQLIYSTLSK